MDPFADQSQDAAVANPPLDHRHEVLSDDAVEVGDDVELQNIFGRFPANDPANLIQCLLGASPRAKTVGARQKILLIDRLQQFHRRPLHDLIFQGRDRDRSLAPVLLLDIDSSQRMRPVALGSQLLMQLLDSLPRLRLVLRVGQVVHSRTGVLPQSTKRLVQRLRRQ
jgi:hypothetical protein